MPTYDYECARCGTMEIFQSMKDDALKSCPECGSRKFHKLVSKGAGVIFKGQGFWETDYNRSSSYQEEQRKEASSPSPSTEQSTAKGSAASDSKASATSSSSEKQKQSA